MVSQFGLLGYTIMGKTADLTVVQKTIIDTLHKEENRSIERLVKQNRFKNLGELHKEWTEAGVKASSATTHRRVKEFGYSCRIPLVKPLLNHRQCQRRLTWAKEKKKWTVAQWSKQSVMIRGAMSSAGVGPLCFLKTKVTAPIYQEILEHFMLPSADQLFKDVDFIFRIWHLPTLPKAPKVG
ncbi:Transposable element Tcb1 transposase [Labeo rohita]|uniref:Transposable element Tcb1 transposase n=1 Tax=Labeo rohita TaxID=84645 RepID=A0ABQ8LKC4_LABRO|nr:Transposable element Tcb1 transposase [Labeo rohita]